MILPDKANEVKAALEMLATAIEGSNHEWTDTELRTYETAIGNINALVACHSSVLAEVERLNKRASTRDFLSTLDYDQLVRAKKLTEELIKKKDSEPRTNLWVVGDDCQNIAAFFAEDYDKAIARAHKLLDEEAKRGVGIVIQIESYRYRESEVADMLALDKSV